MTDDSCPICQAKLSLLLDRVIDAETGETFSIWQCADCILGVTRPVPAELGRYYGKDYHGGRHGITTGMCDRRRVRIVSRYVAKGRLLDVGCGEGTFLKTIESAGWTVYGVERYPERSRSLGLTIYEDLEQASEAAPLKCVTLWHCLEHLTDPGQSLRQIRSTLADNGSVIIAVPNANSLQARLAGRNWLHLDVPRHVFHFSETSLEQLAIRHGLVATRLPYTELEYDLMDWTQSVLNGVFPQRDLFFRIVTGKNTNASLLTKVACVTLGTIVCALALVPSVVGAITGRGGTLVMRMQRQENSGREDQDHV